MNEQLREIANAVHALTVPGQVVELRAFVTNGRGYTETLGGYFDDPDRMATEAVRLSKKGASGVYFTPNPLLPSLLARARNRMKRLGKGEGAKNHEVQARRLFLLDFDPVRPKGVSSTDREHEAAHERAKEVGAYLKGLSFPRPFYADSGNGAHLLYRVDLDVDDGGLCKRALKALSARFSDGEVDVDISVHNAARIWKLYGTTARKGDPLPDRPHRRSRLLFAPSDPQPVLPELLEAVSVSEQTLPPKAGKPGGSNDTRPSPEQIAAALKHIRPRPGYEEWVRIIAGVLEGCGGDVHEAEGLLKSWMPEEHEGEYAEKLANPLERVTFGTVVHHAEAGGWVPPWKVSEEPVALGEARAEVVTRAASQAESAGLPWRPFPTDVLPPAARDVVRASAAAIDCDEALVALPVLAVLSAAVGNSHVIQLKNGWREPAALWFGIIAPSGSAKSPAMDAAVWPVDELSREAARKHRAELQAYEIEVEAYKRAGKDEKPERPTPPKRRRYRMADATVESAGVVHAENPRGVFLARDELAGWLGSFDQYKGGGSDLQTWMEMYEGKPSMIDRVSRQQGAMFIPRACLTVCGTVQPKVLREKVGSAHLDSGFIPRLRVCMPPIRPRRWTDADVTDETRRAYELLVKRLYAMPYDPEQPPTVVDASAKGSPARAAFVAFFNENAERAAAMPDGVLRSTLAKLEAVAARLALILHLSDHAGRSTGDIPGVSGHAMERAVALTRWLRHEAVRVYDALGFEELALSKDERIALSLPESFTWQDVKEAAGVTTKRGAYKVLDRLKEKGLVEQERHGQYRNVKAPEGTGHFVHPVHFAGDEVGPSVQSERSELSPEGHGAPRCAAPAYHAGQRVEVARRGPGTVEEASEEGRVRVRIDALADTPMPVRVIDPCDLTPADDLPS